MSPLFSVLDRLNQRFFCRSYGWVGIEIGCHEINFAQVRKLEDRWQLAAVWTVEHISHYVPQHGIVSGEFASPCDETFGWLHPKEILDQGLAASFDQLQNLNSLFSGRNCAATLTDGMIAYREIELPTSDESECKAMVHSEIALDSECDLDEILADCWELPTSNTRGATTCHGAVSLNRKAAMTLASDLLKAGFECQTLDAVPCAMARATEMVATATDEATLAIDLGYMQTTVTLVMNGRPILSRALRNLGLLAFLEKISRTFEISVSDAQTLLFQSPATCNGTSKSTDSFSNPLHQELNGFVQTLAKEIEKTIRFTSKTYRTMLPKDILLMGPGGKVPSIEKTIEHRIGLPTKLWRIEVAENLFGNQFVSCFAVAAGLSCMAWEGLSCT